MPTRPPKNLRQSFGTAGQGDRQGGGFCCREVGELDTGADIEGREAYIADEVRRGNGPDDAERQPPELGVLRTSVVALTDRTKELIGLEGQVSHDINLVQKHHEVSLKVLQGNLAQRTKDARQGREFCVVTPVG